MDLFETINAGDMAAVLAAVAADAALVHARDGHLGSTPLIFAAHRGFREMVRAFLDAGADVNAREVASGSTALHWASEGGHAEIAAWLVDAGAAVDVRDEWWDLTPLGWATVVDWAPQFREDRPATIARLLAEGARHDVFTAITVGDADAMRASDVSRRLGFVQHGLGALHYAAALGRRGFVKALLALGADPAAPDDWGLPPLAFATGSTVELLAAWPVAPTPALVFGAAYAGRVDWLADALRAGADPNARTRYLQGEAPARVTPLHLATTHGHPALIRALVDAGAAVDGPGDVATPLHVAAGRGSLDAVKALVEAGASLTATDPVFHATPRGWALHGGHTDVVAWFDVRPVRTC